MTCGDCGKTLIERTVATKTKKVDGDVIVLAQRQALVCDEHGVVAWDPTHPVTISYPVPYVQPWIAPVIRPWPVTVQPWTTYPNPLQRPNIMCGSTSGLSGGGIVNGNSTRALATVN